MCGIIAIVRRRPTREAPTTEEIKAALPDLEGSLVGDARAINGLAEQFEALDRALSGVPGVTCLLRDPALVALVAHCCEGTNDAIASLEAWLHRGQGSEDSAPIDAALVRLKDAVWSIGRDRLRTAEEVGRLCQGVMTAGAVEAYLSVQESLSAIDRLEVRGRDSAGLHLLVRGHALDLEDAGVADEIGRRGADPNFGSGSVREADGHLGFVYKAAAEIGELGDNTRAIRQAILDDDLLRRALANDTASATLLGHTRWASVGI
ncbi:MAG: glucosamine-6-phosphate synthase, partial [Acidimicrobiales bacterium]